MKLTPVDQIPKMNGYHKLQELIEEFTNGDAKIVKVEFSETDYKSPAVCRSCLAAAIKRSKRPVKVWRRGNEIFLSRDCTALYGGDFNGQNQSTQHQSHGKRLRTGRLGHTGHCSRSISVGQVFVRQRCARLPIGKATRNGNLVASIEEMDSRYGRINFYISPKRLYEETGYFWRGERR